jgi:hypothetical protein
MLSAIQSVSVLGSLLVLLAYVANQFGWPRMQGLAYAFANIVGSGVLAVIASLDAQWGFLVLEGAWASVSLVAAVRQRAKPEKPRRRRSWGAMIAGLWRAVMRTRERRATLVHGELSDRADELWFELSKGPI